MQIGSTEWKRLFQNGAEAMGIEVASVKLDQFAVYAAELMHWNRTVNLTTINDPKEVVAKHFLDSLAPATFLSPHASLLDIGSGGGFPGIPLKIVFPNLSVCLIESSRKKVSFLKHVIRTLRLQNIDAVNRRAEDFSPDAPFGVVISRAVSGLDRLIEIGRPLLADDGMIIAFKGKNVKTEVEAVRCRSIENATESKLMSDLFSFEIRRYILPNLEIERFLVVIRRL
jgi:16S rRNA (guanine527-N7)-methyltransferase